MGVLRCAQCPYPSGRRLPAPAGPCPSRVLQPLPWRLLSGSSREASGLSTHNSNHRQDVSQSASEVPRPRELLLMADSGTGF